MNVDHEKTVAEGVDNSCYSVSTCYIFPFGSCCGLNVCVPPPGGKKRSSYVEALTLNMMEFVGD